MMRAAALLVAFVALMVAASSWFQGDLRSAGLAAVMSSLAVLVWHYATVQRDRERVAQWERS